ncbi:E3 ubiquitin-protein ligase RNF182-like [Embiotoca jacksoni]|uniref:E3 ubiquitin-protein ligase RNF182-like n=1 Tax=Embiotoca jacksoni TaxID=100190 RepID=UPI003703C3A3
MSSEIKCTVCYWTYNAGRRCPRELHCKHSFCESCLLALSRPLSPVRSHQGRLIICPLCRFITSISGEGQLRAELRVDECTMERLLAAGVLDQEEDEDPEEMVQDCDDEEEEGQATRLDTSAAGSDSIAGTVGGRLRRSWSKLWLKIWAESPRRRSYEEEEEEEEFSFVRVGRHNYQPLFCRTYIL